MQFHSIYLTEDSKLDITSSSLQALTKFCHAKRNETNSQCEFFYQKCFSELNDTNRSFIKCPYGLHCVGLIKWTQQDRIASGFLFEADSHQHQLNGAIDTSTKEQVLELLSGYDKIADELYQQSYRYLEAAIHDVRHLNADVTAHAERLLSNLGYAETAEWDKAKLNSQETDKRTLSIYCASRDISAALSMHEIAIDPRRASGDVAPTNIHKIFYRQKQVNLEKLEKKKLTVQLENTSITKGLTRSFQLIPIILLNNAIKYSENNSTIQIKFQATGNIFRIIFTNYGPIVRANELLRVFQKNYRGSNRSGVSGHGIGLWLASLIVHANLGTIEMEIEETGRDIAGRKTGRTSVVIRLT